MRNCVRLKPATCAAFSCDISPRSYQRMAAARRAEHEPVYSSVTPDDFAKLAAHLGFEGEAHGRREPVVHLRHGKRPFLASLSGRIGDGSLYSIVVLEAALTSPGAIDDGSVERINDTLRFARVSRAGEQALVLSMQGSAGETAPGGWPNGPLRAMRAEARRRWWLSRW